MGRERYGGGLDKGVMGRLEGFVVVMHVSLEHMEFHGTWISCPFRFSYQSQWT